MIIHSPVLYSLYLCYAHGFAVYNTSNPLRFFSVIIHSPVLYPLYLCYAHGFAVYNTSNSLRFFSVIIHSPNTFIFLCKQKLKVFGSLCITQNERHLLQPRSFYYKVYFMCFLVSFFLSKFLSKNKPNSTCYTY